MRYQVVHSTVYSYSTPVPLCQNELHLGPRSTTRQQCLQAELTIQPRPTSLDHCRDYFGNTVHFLTIEQPHLELSVTAKSELEVTPSEFIEPAGTPGWEQVRDAVKALAGPSGDDPREFTCDSPHVLCSRDLAAFAGESFTRGRPWMEAVLDLIWRIHRDFEYDPAATCVSTPLAEVLTMRRGVCQDFAHLAIGCLRSLGLPARYVSGYLLTSPAGRQPRLVGADASHAWLSAYAPQLGWIDFDPTNNLVPCLDHMTVAWGRDYSDVCPIKGVFVGGGEHSMRVSVDVRPI
jgi:transglutaminase-like putative cysteine protease